MWIYQAEYTILNIEKSTAIQSELRWIDGGDEEDRTLDLTDANRTLSQLSYAPGYLVNIIIAHIFRL